MTQPSILLVEDEAIVALDLKMQLEELGYRVVGIADAGQQAVELARRHRPDLALMDIMLRGPMDGIQAADTLRREFGTPVVFLTSFNDTDTVRRAARTAAYGYLTKPFQIKELTAGIEVALYKSTMERQLREADRWFASTLRCVADGVVVTELDSTIRFMNPAAELLTGWPLAEARGRQVDDVVRFGSQAGAAGEGEAGAASAVLAEGRVTSVQHACRLRTRGAGDVAVDRSAGPVSDESGVRVGAVLVLRNATDRLKQELRLRASEERFRSAFDFAPLGMALVALDGRFLLANDALCRFLGRDAKTLGGQRQADVTFAEDRAHEEQRLHELLTSGVPVVQFEKRYQHAAGQPLWWALVSVSLLQEEGEPTCFLYQVHDLSEQKKAAEQLAELAAERMKREAVEMASKARSEFMSRVSHEMRTPLNAVLGFGQLLQLAAKTGNVPANLYADHIVSAGTHLLSMVDDVLDIQRGDQGGLRLNMQRLAADVALREVIELLRPSADAQHVAFDVDAAAGLYVNADPTRLRQVLLNLGSNAVKYNRVGGRVRWTAGPGAEGGVCLAVADEGIGMTSEQLGKLFQPFERLGRENSAIPGTGLGLVIARSLSEQMGATMALSSVPRQGTRVVLTFPAV